MKLPKAPTFYAVLVFVLFLMAAYATQCRASELEVNGGATIVRGNAAVLKLDIIFPRAGPLDSDYRCGIALIGPSEYNGDQRQQAAAQCQMIDGFGKLDLGLGLVYLQNIDAYNGSHTNFSLSIGYRFTERFSVTYQHWSNAGTTKSNKGRDFITLGWRF